MTLRPGDDFDRDILDIIPERFDADADSRQARAGHRLRTTVTLILAVAAIGAIVAVGLRFMGSKPATDANGIPVIKADDRPIRVRPDDRGGMEVPNQDKLVYQKMEGQQEEKTEQLLPAPEQPMAPPKAAAPAPNPPEPAAAGSAGRVADASAAKPAGPAVASPPPPAAPAAVDNAEEKPADSYRPVGERAQPAAPSSPAPAQAAPASAPVAAKPAAPAHAAAVPESAHAQPAPEHKMAAPAGAYVVQLGAVRSKEAADKEWARISHAHAALLSGLKSDIVRVDLEGRGVFWRVRAGSLTEAAAHHLCEQLAKQNQGCIVGHK